MERPQIDKLMHLNAPKLYTSFVMNFAFSAGTPSLVFKWGLHGLYWQTRWGRILFIWGVCGKEKVSGALPPLSMKGGDDDNSSSTPTVAVLIDLLVILMLPLWDVWILKVCKADIFERRAEKHNVQICCGYTGYINTESEESGAEREPVFVRNLRHYRIDIMQLAPVLNMEKSIPVQL